MLTVRDFSQHLVLSSKTIRPNIHLGAGCMVHCEMVWSGVCSLASHSQFVRGARPHLYMDERKRPTPERRRLSLTQAALGIGPLTSRYHFLKSLPTFIFMLNVVRHSSFIKEWALGGPGFIFGKSCRVGYRYWAKGSRPWAVRVAKKKSARAISGADTIMKQNFFLEDLANYLDWGKWCWMNKVPVYVKKIQQETFSIAFFYV